MNRLRDLLFNLMICTTLSTFAMPHAMAFVIDDGGTLPPPPHSTIVAAHSTVDGKTIAQWGEEWWKWVLETPAATNPQFDTNGTSANLGNVGGSVFFLAGNFGGVSERTFSAPQAKYFLLPLVNTVWIPDPGESLDLAINETAADINTVSSLNAVIDGVVVTDVFNHREATTLASGGFSFTAPDNGLVPAGTYGPTAQDGYWLMLTLAPGQHTISFGGTKNSFADSFLVTDHINVVPIPAGIWLFGSALLGFGALRKQSKS